MEVDLLWNGGIGTYVKASHESHADAGDRSNDAVRIDASDLRARIVGEGGNLGLTQAARVEASLRGVHLDTDAIDNSAGVDLSDHEVNYKIALAPLVRSGQLDRAARHELLFAVADDACEAALAHNRGQALALSLDELRSRRDPDLFRLAVDRLCEFARLEPAALGLPDEAAVNDRRARQIGFTRPELAVLLGLAKQHAQAELMRGDLPAAGYLESLYRSYFPARFEKSIPDALAVHPLRREITALGIANRLIDAGGAALVTTLIGEFGVGAGDVISAMLQAEDVLRAPEYRARLLERAASARSGIYAALVEFDAGVRDVAHYIVRSGACDLDHARVERWRAGVDALRVSLRDYLSPGELQNFESRRNRLEAQGVPEDVAFDIAGLTLADRGLNILRVCGKIGLEPVVVARIYARLGDETGMNWVYGRLSRSAIVNLWDRMVLLGLRWDLLDLQREITERLFALRPDEPDAAMDEFLLRHAEIVREVLALERRAAADSGPSALAVVTARLRLLRPPVPG
jgi:glutamate dehydrogenase